MRFVKPPQLMTVEELVDRVRSSLVERWPESDALDYKESLNTKTRQDRIELAKDVSSFANELGGTLLYGVPEQQEGGVPIPAPLEKCGLEIDPGIPEKIENILLDSIRPVLPNLFVKTITLPEIRPKQLLVVHHPASWNKPHMVEAYKDRRYFRRGNYRAVPMSEREVEAAYASRRSVQIAAEEFFRTADLGDVPGTGPFLRITIFPVFSLIRREVMREEAFRRWLDENPPAGRRGIWIPFVDGIRFLSYASGNLNGKEHELRLFHNGTLSFTTDATHLIVDHELNLTETEKSVRLYSLFPAAKAVEFLGFVSPLVIKVEIFGMSGIKAFFRDTNRSWTSLPPGVPSGLWRNPTTFVEESSSDELAGQADQVLSRIIDRLGEAFGLWRS
jgi:hypothetical protein